MHSMDIKLKSEKSLTKSCNKIKLHKKKPFINYALGNKNG